jgi:glycosyltransferase involved in cell wall biosynthesis
VHVALVSHYRLPVRKYGGTERVVVALARGLAALGHKVTVVAAPGTDIPEASVIEMPPEIVTSHSLDLATVVPSDVDVIHVQFLVKRRPSRPFLQTMYGEGPPGYVADSDTVLQSQKHARHQGSEIFVYNGLDPADFQFRAEKDDYDLFLGRLHRVKGYRWAIEGARKAKRRLILVGGWRPSFRPGIKFIGKVDEAEKVKLLAGARCLWVPALWEEHFGLTTIEALFSGTPVLGTKRGSLPELVPPEVGALCDTVDEMVAAVGTIHTRSAEACRAHAVKYFSHVAMAEGYLRMYRTRLETGKLPPGIPTPYTPTAKPI